MTRSCRRTRCLGSIALVLASLCCSAVMCAEILSGTTYYCDNNSCHDASAVTIPDEVTDLTFLETFLDNPCRASWPPNLTRLQMKYTSIEDVACLAIIPDSIETLDLSNNYITRLSVDWLPTSLKVLYLNSNRITAIQGTAWPPGITTLQISNNLIPSLLSPPLPSSIRVLNAAENKIAALDFTLPASLAELNLAFNKITTPLAAIAFPQDLTTILLSGNMIPSVPTSWPPSLQSLLLQDNAITSIDDSVFPDTLETIALGSNNISSLDNIVWPTGILMASIDLSNNKLTHIPHQEWAYQIGTFDLSRNQLSAAPNLPEVCQTLDLSENNISSIAGITWPVSGESQKFYLHFNRITSIGSQDWPDTLAELRLDNNLITTLANADLPEFLSLFSLERNKIKNISGTSFPSGISSLRLSKNVIEVFENNQIPDSVKTIDLSGNQLKSLVDFSSLHSLTSLDLSYNGLVSLNSSYLPPSLEVLLVTGNVLKSFPRLSTLPGGTLKRLGLSNNPWQSEFDELSKRLGLTTSKNALELFTLDLPCSVTELSMQHLQSALECTKSTTTDASAAACRGAVQGAENTAWFCSLTTRGETLVAASTTYRQAILNNIDKSYSSFYVSAFPLCFGVTALMWFLAKTSSRKDAMVWLFFFVSSFDLSSDWAFWALELSSSGFKNSYECVPSPAILACDSSTGSYDCGSFADLRNPCGDSDNALANAQNECECYGLECPESLGFNFVDYSLDVSGRCNPDLFGSSFRFDPYECFSYGTLDDHVNSTCGYLNKNDPSLTGSNECECRGHQCVNVPGTGGVCSGYYGGNYEALRFSALGFCCLATVIWIFHWLEVLKTLNKRMKSAAKDAVAEGAKKRFEDKEAEAGGAAAAAAAAAAAKAAFKVEHGEEPMAVVTGLATLLLEDMPFLAIQLIYFSVMEVSGTLAVVSLITTCTSLVLNFLILPNRHYKTINKYGGPLGRFLVRVFTLNYLIPTIAKKYHVRRERKRIKVSLSKNTSAQASVNSAGTGAVPLNVRVNPLFIADYEEQLSSGTGEGAESNGNRVSGEFTTSAGVITDQKTMLRQVTNSTLEAVLQGEESHPALEMLDPEFRHHDVERSEEKCEIAAELCCGAIGLCIVGVSIAGADVSIM